MEWPCRLRTALSDILGRLAGGWGSWPIYPYELTNYKMVSPMKHRSMLYFVHDVVRDDPSYCSLPKGSQYRFLPKSLSTTYYLLGVWSRRLIWDGQLHSCKRKHESSLKNSSPSSLTLRLQTDIMSVGGVSGTVLMIF